MGLPVEETIGGRGQTGEQVKGTGGRSYVVRPMSKSGRRLGQAEGRGAQARTADGQWQGRCNGEVWFAGSSRSSMRRAASISTSETTREDLSGPATCEPS